MLLGAGVLAWVLAALVAVQVPYLVVSVRALRRSHAPLLDDDACPWALVVLPLRGGDEALRESLTALLHQDYPRFHVRIVVDAPEDPAWEVVTSTLERHPRGDVRVEPLRARLATCTLKCSGLLQALEALDGRYAFTAHLDGDTVPHPTWLRELAGGFRDPSVGVVTGNRWYRPVDHHWGSVVRALWNAAAVPGMIAHHIAWGGTMAVRADLAARASVREAWRRAFSEDTALAPELARAGLRVCFLPSLVMVDRSGCTLPGFWNWVRRQILAARLHHPAWPALLAHGVLTSVGLALALVGGVGAVLAGDWDGAAAILGLLSAYQGLLVGAFLLLDREVERVLRRRSGSEETLPRGILLRAVAAVPVAQAAHAAALAAGVAARHVTWRGTRYRILRGGGVRRVADGGATGGGHDG